MSVFQSLDYKDYLQQQARQTRGNLTVLSRAAGCQPSYLLRVINEEAHLTPDQAFRLCNHWGLAEEERKFFMTLVESGRAADPAYQKALKRELANMLAEQQDLRKVTQRESISEIQTLLEYHADWRISLVHFLSACPDFQGFEKLSKRVALSTADIKAIVDFLQVSGFVERQPQGCRFKTGAGHIPKGSPILPIFLNSWRQLAASRSSKMDSGSIHFTNIQTIGRADLRKLQALALQFIREAKAICDHSDSDEVIALNLDVFVP